MIILSLVLLLFAIFSMQYKNKNRIRVFAETILILLFGLITIVYIVSNYFTGEGINNAVLAALSLGLGDAGFQEYALLIITAIFCLIFLFITSFFYYKNQPKVEITKPKKIKSFLYNGFLILAFLVHPFFQDTLALYNEKNHEQSDDFYNYYVTPKTPKNESNKNLVHIYLESFEKTYFDEELFPSLTTNLKSLINKNGIEFTNIHQVSGSEYTIAGMTASQCGTPLFAPNKGNSMSGIEKFYPRAKCTGDILKEMGYYLSFMQGSSTHFSGIDKFYETHGFDSVKGKEQFLDDLEDRSYLNGWGLYDDTLLDYAFEEFATLSEEKEKFALFTISLDTHHPNGHLSDSCKDYLYGDGANDILNSFKCSDKLVSKFIEKIQGSKYADNTIIVITSDHLAMRNTASDMMPSKKDRRNLFVILDNESKSYRSIDKNGTTLDIAPTILSTLNIYTDVGLGRNLFTSTSIFDEFKNINSKLASWRETLLLFWDFPKLSNTLRVNFEKTNVRIGNQILALPVLLKIDKTSQQISPLFEEGVPEKLYEQLLRLKTGDMFIWIDYCVYQSYLFSYGNQESEYCITQGNFGKIFEVNTINPIDKYEVKDFDKLASTFISEKQLKKKIYEIKNFGIVYQSTLNEGIKFNKIGYPNFLTNVKGMSTRENWGRWSDANTNEYVEFEFKENLPNNFQMAFEVGAFGPNLNKEVKVVVGEKEHRLKLIDPNPRKYEMEFKNIKNIKNIKIIPPIPTSPASLQQGGDERKLGISFVSLKIKIIDNIQKDLFINNIEPSKIIAHAGGAIDGITYTNTLAALNENYKKGFRLFELDIIETSDGAFVASHDWNTWRRQTEYEKKLPPTSKEFLSYKVLDKYETLDIDKINQWFQAHKDAVLVTDKVNKPKMFSDKFIDKERLIMELFSWEAVEEALANNIRAMPTWGIIEQIKGSKTKFLLEKNINLVAASRSVLSERYFDLNEMKESDIKVYAFHVDHENEYNELYMICHEFNYFYGMYADNWDFRTKFENSECTENAQLKPTIGYHSTLKDGIIFSKEGYPDFLKNIKGMSHLEKWGRWSDANENKYVEFEFKENLPKNFDLEFEVGAFGPNLNKEVKVKVGDKEERFELMYQNPTKYTVKFEEINNIKNIKIIPPMPTSPASLDEGDDERKLGLSFVSLKIY